MKGKTLRKAEARAGISFVAPVIFWYAIFFWGPLVFVFTASFTEWDMFSQMEFVGLRNYKELFLEPYFFKSLSISLIYTLSSTALLVCLGLIFAVLFDRPGLIASLARLLFFMTAVLPLISAGAIWVWIAGPEAYSGLNSLMSFLGLGRKRWLVDSNTALLCVIGFNVWKNTGFNVLIYTAGLRGVPSVYIDAARVDGASKFNIIKRIVIPLLSPIIIFLTVINMINSWRMFAPVWFLTKGGPGTATRILPIYVYEYGFNQFRFGFASAAATILIGIVFIFTYLRLRSL